MSNQLSHQWHEAQRRAESYLRALRGVLGTAERELLVSALTTARAHHQWNAKAHPVALVMETLFDLLPIAEPAVTMAPPIQRATMLPEPIQFPVRDWLRGWFRRRVAFAGPN